MDKIPYKRPYSKNAKRKSGYIKNINNEVLGKGERERENRFYKIGFPLALKIKKENRFYENRFPSRSKNKKRK